MTARAPHVSVIDPISPAIERVKTVLFRPFDLGRWFVIGWCAFLAHLGQGGGGGGGGGGRGRGGRHEVGDVPAAIRHAVDQAREFVNYNLDWLIPLGIFLFVLFVVLTLFIVWVSSRGRFAFLYCVAQNKAEFWNPWRRFRDHGNSLFVFRIVLGIIGFITIVGILAAGVMLFIAYRATLGFNVFSIMGIVLWSLLFLSATIVFGLIGKFTEDFVVPIMYSRTASCVEAWRVLLDVMGFNKARFVLYVLFQLAIGLVIGALMVGAACVTCCCACCLFAIPYIGTVVLLPIHVFTRSYSLYYLAQYGAEFEVIAAEPVTPAPGDVPPA